MQIELKQSGTELAFALKLSDADSSEGAGQHGRIQLCQDSFRFVLPYPSEIHPDLLAMALLSVVLPFAFIAAYVNDGMEDPNTSRTYFDN